MRKKTANDYNDRVNHILRALTEGKSREEVANTLNYATWRSLDMFMRRKGFYWDAKAQNYVSAQAKNELKSPLYIPNAKVAAIISLFESDEAEARSIAKQIGFNDHREMAEYMKRKGYVWSPEGKNYVKHAGKLHDLAGDTSVIRPVQEAFNFVDLAQTPVPENSENLALLKMLERNKERLIDLLMPVSETGIVPHYAVPGVTRTKSVYMSDSLCNLVAEFCGSKNVTQKQIFEAALIEFLKRYGYGRNIDSLLK